MTIPPLQGSPGTTNLIANPSFEVDTSSTTVTSLGMTLATTAEQATSGSQSLKISADGSATICGAQCASRTDLGGTARTLTASADVHAPAGRTIFCFFRVYYTDGTNTFTTDSTRASTGAWQRITYTATTDAAKTVNYVQVSIRVGTGSVPTTVYLDAVQLEDGATATPYTDTSRPASGLPGLHRLGSPHIGPLRVGKD